MNVQDVLDKALEFASEKHKGQLDDSGRPYFFAHCVQVYGILKDVTDDFEVLCAGILHDTLEDTETTFEELVDEFTPNIATIVEMVSHEGKKDETGYYFPRLVPTRKYSVLMEKAITVKFADRLSNLSRMGAWNAGRRAQYLRRSVFWKTEPKTHLPESP
jgi:GTP pyrophosphokinase